jgi:transcriptional regulator of arginine metabolism
MTDSPVTRMIPPGCTRRPDLHTYTYFVYIYASAAALRAAFLLSPEKISMKFQRHNAIRELVAHALVANQDEMRRKLRRRGFEVTQATLSRGVHELKLTKGPGGYSLPNGNGNGNGAGSHPGDDGSPTVVEMMESFGLSVTHAMNQVVLRTTMGGAQPMAAALDRTGWQEVVGTIAGDDTVLVICPDVKRAHEIEARLRKMLES